MADQHVYDGADIPWDKLSSGDADRLVELLHGIADADPDQAAIAAAAIAARPAQLPSGMNDPRFA